MKVPTEVLEVLDQATTDGNALRLAPGQLDRKLYVSTDKVLAAAGGKWNRSAKAHLFEGDAADAIEQVILTGEVVTQKQEFGYFPTPPPVVARLMEIADIAPGMEVLEPSAGRGAIASAAADLGAVVDCIEVLPANLAAITTDGYARSAVLADFLETEPEPSYDRVVMNPPFAKQADIAHVTHALKFLKPDGVLVAVMSAGVIFRTGRAEAFRQLVTDHLGCFEDLPDDAFKESGTGVRTVIVTIPVTP